MSTTISVERTERIADLLPQDPQSIGAYRLLGRLGAGGMGIVYLAETVDGRRYALKVVAANQRLGREARARLGREARTLGELDHPNIARIVEFDSEANPPFLVMDYVAGAPLDRAIPAGGLAAKEVRSIGAQLAGALSTAHKHGVTHRDIKPRNVILGNHEATLIDFGIASFEEEGTTALTREGAFLGSLAWLAPEVIRGSSADTSSDVFALGLVLAYMATGRHPFGEGRPESIMYRVMHELPNLHSIDPRTAAVIAATLQRHPDDRPTAADLVLALRADDELPVAGAARHSKRPGSDLDRKAARWGIVAAGSRLVGHLATLIGRLVWIHGVLHQLRMAMHACPAASAPMMHKRGEVGRGLTHLSSVRNQQPATGQLALEPGDPPLTDGSIDSELVVTNTASQVLWDVLSNAYQRLQFDRVGDDVFRDLVLARVVEPNWKYPANEVIEELGLPAPQVDCLQAVLRRCSQRGYRDTLTQALREDPASSAGGMAAMIRDDCPTCDGPTFDSPTFGRETDEKADSGRVAANMETGAHHDLNADGKPFPMATGARSVNAPFDKPREVIEAHLTIESAALAVAHHLQNETGMSISRIVRTLRPLRTAQVRVGAQTITAVPQIDQDAREILERLTPINTQVH